MADQIKILFYSDIYEPHKGGLVTSLSRILKNLAKQKLFDLHLLSYNEELASRTPIINQYGFTEHYHGLGETGIAYLYGQTATRSIIRLQRKYNFDILVAFYAHMPLLTVATASEAFDVPFVVCARGSDINDNMEDKQHRAVMRDYIKKAACVVCVSEKIKQNVIEWELVPSNNKIEVIGNSIKIKKNEKCHDQKKNGNPKYDFVFVGAARPVKRFDMVLEAMSALKEKKINAKLAAILIFHRKYPELPEQYKMDATSKQIEHMIEFLPVRSHKAVKKLLSVSKCCLIASEKEGHSNMMIEAMAAGCSIIARNGIMPADVNMIYNRMFSDLKGLVDGMIDIYTGKFNYVDDNVLYAKLNYDAVNEVELYKNLFLKIADEHKRHSK